MDHEEILKGITNYLNKEHGKEEYSDMVCNISILKLNLGYDLIGNWKIIVKTIAVFVS